MKYFLFIFLIFFLSSCSKPKTVLICGDHICVNKSEAEDYFEKNLSIEVKIFDLKLNNEIDLVKLNLNNEDLAKRQITILPIKDTKNKIKTLSKKEIIEIKEKIKNKNRDEKIVKQIPNNNDFKKKKKDIKKKTKNIEKNLTDIVDVCTILEKCSIDEISKYLLDRGKNKEFPNITIRQ